MDESEENQPKTDRTESGAAMHFEEYRDRVEWPVPRLFAEYGREHKAVVTVAVVASVVSPVVSLFPPYMLSVAIDGVLLGDPAQFDLPGVPAARLPDGRLAQLYLVGVVVVASAALSTVLSWVSALTWGKFSQAVQHVVRTDVYEKVQHLGMDFFEDQQTGQVLSILSNDVEELESLLESLLGDTLRIAAQFLGIAAFLLVLHWQFALVALAFVPVMAAMSRHFVGLIRHKYEQVRQRVGALTARIENNLGGIHVIKSFAAEPYEADRVERASRDVYERRWDVVSSRAAFFPAMNFVNWLGFGVLLVVGGVWITRGPPLLFTEPLSVGVLVSFLVYNQRFTRPLIQAGHLVDRYYEARAAVVRIFALRDYDVRIEPDDDAAALGEVAGRVAFESVSFGYEADGEPVLDDVSFEVESGEFVGIVGPTGAGKTTLAKLLLRFYDPDAGTVALDGRDVRDLDLRSLRGAVGLVSQDPYLFSGTVRENVAYGTVDATDEEVERAARTANAHGFVTEFEDGYDTRVGQRGVKLSGGQRQRIAIARALLSDPDVLVFDEATSHVDNETEALIQRSLRDVTADRTTFAIAHRLSTIRHADTILVLDEGRVVERGTHEELVGGDGLYADLWRMQVGELEDVSSGFLDARARD